MNKKTTARVKGKDSSTSGANDGGADKDGKPSDPEATLRSYQSLDNKREAANLPQGKSAKAIKVLPDSIWKKVMSEDVHSRLGAAKVKLDPANNNIYFSLEEAAEQTAQSSKAANK